MKYEIRAYYSISNINIGVATLDKELSSPAVEITREQAEKTMSLLEAIGLDRHETSTQIFYDYIRDSRHYTEYIFYK